MAVEIEGRVGPATVTDGTVREVSLDRTAAQRTSAAHGRWYEASVRGNTFMASTAVGGVIPGTALGATTSYVLYNPTGSDVDLVVMAVGVGYISGTLGAGTIVAAKYTENAANAAPVVATATVPVCTRLGLNQPKAKVFSAGTLTAAPLIMFPLFDLGAKLATTALQSSPFIALPNGAVIVTPGTALCLHGITAAGDTPLIVYAALWEEVLHAS